VKAEVRGRGDAWSVWYEDESGLPSPVAVYDRDGVLKGTIEAGNPTGKLVAAHFTGPRAEAEAYARWLGADEVKRVRVQERATRAPKEPNRPWLEP
jgi:hypothetical protein